MLALAAVSATPAKFAPSAPPVTALLDACAEKDGWTDPAPPARIDGQVYYVGTCGISVLLVASPQGHVLIDAGPEEAAPLVLANIRRLGLDPKDVKWLLNTHSHWDHAGGLAALQAATGARVAALPDQARELESGAVPTDDPQFGLIDKGIKPVKVARILRDGVPFFVGPNRITPFSTPGHTKGSTSWVIRGCGKGNCPAVVYADSASTPTRDGYRFGDHPAWTAQFRRGVTRIGTLPCAILVTPHPGQSTLFERFAGDAPLRDAQGCKRYADYALGKFDERLAKERAGP
ncbi:MAG: subclass B3 metallo-beta-lactamase [Novosphingobium sp.]